MAEQHAQCDGAVIARMLDAEAEDVVQDVFLKVHRARAAFRPRAKFTTWLFTICRNTCFNVLRDGRGKARLGVRKVDKKGRVLVGFRERHAPFIADMLRCEVLAEPVDALIAEAGEIDALVANLSINAPSTPAIEVTGFWFLPESTGWTPPDDLVAFLDDCSRFVVGHALSANSSGALVRDAFESAVNAGVLDRSLLDQLEDDLRQLKPMKGVFSRDYVKKLDGPNKKAAANKKELAEALRADIRRFKEENDLDRMVMIWCGSTEIFLRPGPVHATLESFERGMEENDPAIAPSMLYAYAALMEGVPYANGAPNLSADIPALVAREVFIRLKVVRRGAWLFTLVTAFCLAISAFYEFIEWWVAVASGESADAFLSLQGYVWDTQADMWTALVGAVSALVLLGRWHDRQLESAGYLDD